MTEAQTGVEGLGSLDGPCKFWMLIRLCGWGGVGARYDEIDDASVEKK